MMPPSCKSHQYQMSYFVGNDFDMFHFEKLQGYELNGSAVDARLVPDWLPESRL